VFTAIYNTCKSFLNHLKDKIKKITKPATATLAAGALSDLPRSKSDLIVENAILRQQLIVLNRTVKRPILTDGDRFRLTFLARLTGFWHSALHIVQPETLLRWHRDLFRRYWKRKSKPESRKPRIPQETIDLIKQMAIENPRWGAKKIRGELLKLGIDIHKRTIKRYMRQVRKRNSGQNWAAFLKNHAGDIWACDFTTVHTLFFKPIYILVFMELQTRRIVHTTVTLSPTDAWAAQQLREATAWGHGPKYLIRDNDNKFGKQFSTVAESTNIEELKTPFQAPKANAICERLIGTLKQECLDYHLILHPYQLRRIVNEFVAYYNQSRPHQGIEQHIPAQFNKPRAHLSKRPKGKVIATPVLNGLHHSYAYAGALH
jgi:transposase InsO family protein